MKKVYNKLVRDRIPEIIEKDGASFKTSVLNDEDFKTELLKKLIEEAQEVVGAKDDNKELVKELGDMPKGVPKRSAMRKSQAIR